MAAEQVEAQPRRSAEFVESSILEAVVPADTSFDVQQKLDAWDGNTADDHSSIAPFVTERQFIIFDERVPVYVVFRTPSIDNDTLRAYLSRLAITLDVFAFSTAPPPEPEAKPPPPKELIYSETIKDSKEPLILRPEVNSQYVYVIWRLEVFISRPHGRFYKPAIYFQPTANLKPPPRTERPGSNDEYLPSKVPTALNLLQAFESDPALAGAHPRLSALRINKIAPSAPVVRELIRPIKTGQRRLFRTVPALIWRIRYSKKHTSLSDASLIASLDLEIAHVTGCKVQIESIELSLKGGRTTAIANHQGQQLVHQPGDQITYLYELEPELNGEGGLLYGPEGHILSLTIKANALVSDTTVPVLSIEWRTPVDFAGEQNQNFMKAAHRASNPIAQAPQKHLGPDSFAPQEEDAPPAKDAQKQPINVTVTVTGPPQVRVAEFFHWNIFIVNRSDKVRKLAVLVLPKRKRDFDKHKSNPSTSSIASYRRDSKELLASAVVDENIIYARQKSARSESADLLCLTTDVRIGHLAPGACYTVDLKFLALCSGVFGVESVRIIDLATQETADIRDLPSIVATETLDEAASN
ncbi:hypothetical protein BU24DRAFT_113008 [Aaosphaeria arxii CBS 175.79]|uniref:Trafficking protein particle complex II-specific subunit 65 IgD3 domain-containing protein n=1 Tax=Aaosphaeria arxii CBS 175.79 TaxID=1450172 RepID=A0A6A5Y2V0_9PLEO|nr:uncharacterized protein BU24DRAFT_113008 [Aaosphaeria arxii CBS 175.79]KAF2019130.1 hypothetical protein BU24DRAFT_113008 [Aaosphaeria arxii CBS 175.79]